MMAAAHGQLTPAEPQICHGRNRAPVATLCAHRAARCTTGGPVRCNAFPSCDRPLMCGAVRLQVPAAAQAGVVRPVRGSPKAARCVLRPPRAVRAHRQRTSVLTPLAAGLDERAAAVSIATAYISALMTLHAQPPRSHLLPTAEAGAQPLAILPALNRFASPRPPASKSLPSGIRRPGQRPAPPRLSACSPSPVTLPPAPRAADEVEQPARAPATASRKSSAATRWESTGTRSRGVYRCDERSP